MIKYFIYIILLKTPISFQIYNKNSIIFKLLKKSSYSQKLSSCLTRLSKKNIISNFSKTFNPYCKSLTKCYQVPDKELSTKSDCDKKYITDLKSECEKIETSETLKKQLCSLAVRNHKQFIEKYLQDYYKKKNALKLVRIMFYKNSTCLTDEKFQLSHDVGCNEETSLSNWLLIFLSDGKFAIKNYVTGNCIWNNGSNKTIEVKECDFDDESFQFFIELVQNNFFLIKTVVPRQSDSECFKNNTFFDTCDATDANQLFFFTYANSVGIKLVDMSDYGF